MSWLVLVRPEAERDLALARDWYEEQAPGLGTRLLDEFTMAMAELESHPDRTPFYHRTFRRILFRQFPYKVFYQVVGERVIVFRVLHAKQAHETRIRDEWRAL